MAVAATDEAKLAGVFWEVGLLDGLTEEGGNDGELHFEKWCRTMGILLEKMKVVDVQELKVDTGSIDGTAKECKSSDWMTLG